MDVPHSCGIVRQSVSGAQVAWNGVVRQVLRAGQRSCHEPFHVLLAQPRCQRIDGYNTPHPAPGGAFFVCRGNHDALCALSLHPAGKQVFFALAQLRSHVFVVEIGDVQRARSIKYGQPRDVHALADMVQHGRCARQPRARSLSRRPAVRQSEQSACGRHSRVDRRSAHPQA